MRGEGKGIRLLCANCSCIDIAKDWTLNVNATRAVGQAVILRLARA